MEYFEFKACADCLHKFISFLVLAVGSHTFFDLDRPNCSTNLQFNCSNPANQFDKPILIDVHRLQLFMFIQDLPL